MSLRRRRWCVPLLTLLIAAGAAQAWSFWTAPGMGSAAASSATLAAAAIATPASGANSVTVTWTQQASLVPSSSANSAITYSVERRLGAGSYGAVASGGCEGTHAYAISSCVDAPGATGSYSYRTVAHFATWTATSNESGPVSFLLDTTAPTVQSIARTGATPSNAGSVSWTITFSEAVTGVNAADFALATTGALGGGAITGVTGSGSTYTVTSTTGAGDGTLGLNLVDDDTIADAGANKLGGTGSGNGNLTGQTYTIDKTVPTAQSIARAGATPSSAASVSWTVTFSETVTGVDTGDFVLAAGGPTSTSISSVSGSGTTYTVTAATGSGDGTLGLNLTDDDTIADAVSNKLGGGGPGNGNLSGQTYTIDRTAPNVAVDDPGAYLRATVGLTVAADDGAGAGITSVKLQRSIAGAAVWTDVCTDSSAPYGCSLDTATVANNIYDLRAIATDGVGLVSTSAIVTVEIDNTPPTITLTDPGATISGTITLVTSPADADSGLDRVTIQRKPTLGSTWTDVCVIAAAPWSCPFDSLGVSDGSYDFRATAVDAAGNATTSSVSTGRLVDNTTVSTVSIVDPGQFLRGTVTLQASANAVGGITNVVIQRRPTAGSPWTDICTDTSTPYSCAFDTTTAATPDGSYDLRAVMTSTIGVQTTSAIVAARTIDNSVVRGVDVQAANKAGGVLGRLEAGDTLTLTYSTAMKAPTLIAGWSGVGSASLSVKLTDAGSAESITLAPGLGTVAAGGNYAQKNKTVTFASTATLSSAAGGGSIVTIVLRTATGTGLRTQSAAVTMKWTPAAAATDLAGVASSTAPVTETGTLDRDF